MKRASLIALIIIALLFNSANAQDFTRCRFPAQSNRYKMATYIYKYPGINLPGITLEYYKTMDNIVNKPLVILIHGGAWTRGSSDDGSLVHEAQSLISLGYAVASLDYSLEGQDGPINNPENHFPESVRDVLCAVKWLKLRAADLGFDRNKIGVIGHSAGGYLAAMIGVIGLDETDFTNRFGIDHHCNIQGVRSNVQALALYYPVTDFYTLSLDKKSSAFGLVKNYVGKLANDAKVLEDASPVRYVTVGAKLPPFIVVHGSADQVVPGFQSQEFSKRLVDDGKFDLNFIAPGLNHGFFPFSVADTLSIENASPYDMNLTENQVQRALAPSTCALISFFSQAFAD